MGKIGPEKIFWRQKFSGTNFGEKLVSKNCGREKFSQTGKTLPGKKFDRQKFWQEKIKIFWWTKFWRNSLGTQSWREKKKLAGKKLGRKELAKKINGKQILAGRKFHRKEIARKKNN